MEISDRIRDRAIGLLTTFRNEALRDIEGISAATQHSTAPKFSSADNKIGKSISFGGYAHAMDESVEIIGEYAHLSDAEVRSLIGWLNHKVTKNGLTGITAKCYRRWLASYFESIGDPCAFAVRNWVPPGSHVAALIKDEGDARLVLGPTLDMSPQPPVLDLKANTRYHTYIERETLTLLLEALLSKCKTGPRYAHGHLAAMFFSATIMLGLRPKEWMTARYREIFYDPEQKIMLGPVLDVRSLKQNNRRDDNPLRENRLLLLDGWPPEQIGLVKGLLGFIAELHDEAAQDSFYHSVRMVLNRAWNRVRVLARKAQKAKHTPGGISSESEYSKLPVHLIDSKLSVGLYTARHIFAEECRRSRDLNRFELAALLGHSMLTNQVHYGPRLKNAPRGYKYILPRPWPGDADDIMAWDNTVNPRRNQFGQGDLFADPQTKLDQDAVEILWERAENSKVTLGPRY